MGIEISLLFPSAFLFGVEYFQSNYPGEHQEIDINLGLFRVTFIWWSRCLLQLIYTTSLTCSIFALWENHLTIRCLHRPLVSRSSSSRNLWPSRRRRPWWWPKPCQWRRKWQTAASKPPGPNRRLRHRGLFCFMYRKSAELLHTCYITKPKRGLIMCRFLWISVGFAWIGVDST